MKIVIDEAKETKLGLGDIVKVEGLGIYLTIRESEQYKSVNIVSGDSFFSRANSLEELEEKFKDYSYRIFKQDEYILTLKRA